MTVNGLLGKFNDVRGARAMADGPQGMPGARRRKPVPVDSGKASAVCCFPRWLVALPKRFATLLVLK